MLPFDLTIRDTAIKPAFSRVRCIFAGRLSLPFADDNQPPPAEFAFKGLAKPAVQLAEGLCTSPNEGRTSRREHPRLGPVRVPRSLQLVLADGAASPISDDSRCRRVLSAKSFLRAPSLTENYRLDNPKGG